ncbi:hypothetical protein CEQ90_04615 [Lewinellaceae bacterium SD302]|nr:hypothetical protein CEQ90_04615 [Lewinellaceae bacterium SD302]
MATHKLKLTPVTEGIPFKGGDEFVDLFVSATGGNKGSDQFWSILEHFNDLRKEITSKGDAVFKYSNSPGSASASTGELVNGSVTITATIFETAPANGPFGSFQIEYSTPDKAMFVDIPSLSKLALYNMSLEGETASPDVIEKFAGRLASFAVKQGVKFLQRTYSNWDAKDYSSEDVYDIQESLQQDVEDNMAEIAEESETITDSGGTAIEAVLVFDQAASIMVTIGGIAAIGLFIYEFFTNKFHLNAVVVNACPFPVDLTVGWLGSFPQKNTSTNGLKTLTIPAAGKTSASVGTSNSALYYYRFLSFTNTHEYKDMGIVMSVSQHEGDVADETAIVISRSLTDPTTINTAPLAIGPDAYHDMYNRLNSENKNNYNSQCSNNLFRVTAGLQKIEGLYFPLAISIVPNN